MNRFQKYFRVNLLLRFINNFPVPMNSPQKVEMRPAMLLFLPVVLFRLWILLTFNKKVWMPRKLETCILRCVASEHSKSRKNCWHFSSSFCFNFQKFFLYPPFQEKGLINFLFVQAQGKTQGCGQGKFKGGKRGEEFRQ